MTTEERLTAVTDDAEWNGGWYQPIVFPDGMRNHASNRTDEDFHGRDSFGTNKWDNLIRPNLPFPLAGRRFLEVGSNAGLFLVKAVAAGAEHAYGIESFPYFHRQAETVMDLFTLPEGGVCSSKITLLNEDAWRFNFHRLCVPNEEGHPAGGIDIALLGNVLYRMTNKDDPTWRSEDELSRLMLRLSQVADYVMVLGDEGMSNKARMQKENHAGMGLSSITTVMEDHYRITRCGVFSGNDRSTCVVVGQALAIGIANVNHMVDELSRRDDKGMSKEFLKAFEYFLRQGANDGKCPIGGPYHDWMWRWQVSKGRTWHGVSTSEQIQPRCEAAFREFGSKEPGYCRPIKMFPSDKGLQIDGYHRLAAGKARGQKYMEVRAV